MGPGLLLPRLLSRAHSWQLVTGQLAALLMCPQETSGRQSGDLGEKWRQFGLRNIFIHGSFTSHKSTTWDRWLRIFITLKNPSTSVGIKPANLGSSGEHANH
jgi:hypothetical protein